MNVLFVLPLLSGLLADPAEGILTTYVGTGQPGYSGNGGPADKAKLNQPFLCDVDKDGNLYIAEAFNHCVRKVDRKTGTISTVAGSGKKGYSGDGGPATGATANEVYAGAVDANGDLYLVDRLNAVVRKVDAKTGQISTVVGTGRKDFRGDGGPGAAAQLREPNDCCLDGKGGLLIADVTDWRIRRLDLKTSNVSTFAGTGRRSLRTDPPLNGDGGPATRAVLFGSRAVCVDGKGNTFVCLREGHSVRKVDDQGIITTIAGTGQPGYSGDGGDAREATFNGPKGIRCDHDGNLFVADTENHAIRKIDVKTGKITTVAGGRKGAGGDGGDASKAELDRPHGCVIDEQGNLYIADSNNHRVRKVKLSLN